MNLSNNKFCIVYYIEEGCLGAKGSQIIESFCLFLEQKLNPLNDNLCYWRILPLIDINKPHFEYLLLEKKLKPEQATRYLAKFGLNLEQFENNIDNLVIDFIEEYLGR